MRICTLTGTKKMAMLSTNFNFEKNPKINKSQHGEANTLSVFHGFYLPILIWVT